MRHPSVSISLVCYDWFWSLFLEASSPPCVSNTFGSWFRVWVRALSSCFLGQTRLDFVSLLHKHQSPPVSQTHLDSGSLSAYLSRIPICAHASVSSLVQTRLILVACLITSISLEPKWLRLTWIIPWRKLRRSLTTKILYRTCVSDVIRKHIEITSF